MAAAALDKLKGMDITEKFREFVKSVDPKSDGKTIDLETLKKWSKAAGLEDKITPEDAASMFAELKTKVMDQEAFTKAFNDICKKKNLNPKEVIDKLMGAKLG